MSALQRQYALNAYRWLPVTFARRVVFGRDPYWRQVFWSRWGRFPSDALRALEGGPVVWIDALAGGEITQSVSFCRGLRERLPQHRLLLTTNNRYSYDFARRNLAVDAVVDAPWDCVGPVRRALARVNPVALVAIENLTAPVLFMEAARRGVTTAVVSGLMSHGAQRHPMMTRAMELGPFSRLTVIGAKEEEDREGFVAAGAPSARVVRSGNMKFDLDFLSVDPAARDALARSLHLGPMEPILLAASVHPGEERLVGEAFLQARRHEPDLRLVLVPRYDFHADAMMATLAELGLASVRRTRLGAGPPAGAPVIVVDTFGELNRLYALATAVFLGGTTYVRNVVGFGQNPIEPLAHRKPLFFGPVMNLWRGIADELKTSWPGLEIGDANDLAKGVVAVLQDTVLVDRILKTVDAILSRHGDDVRRNVDLVVDAVTRRPR